MNSSNIHLGSLFGIPILVHRTTLWFILILALLQGPESGLIFALVLGIVLLHELGHCLAAKQFDIQVIKISLYPFGGMAQMAMTAENPRQELIIALAGPMTNFVLALPGLGFLLFVGQANTAAFSSDLPVALVASWTAINLALGLFNLVPAFPMDGGRVLRALLVKRIGYLPATEIAVRVGRWIAAAMMAYAIFGENSGMGLFFVAIFVWLMGGRELFVARLRHAAGSAGPAGDPRDLFAQMFRGQGGPFQAPQQSHESREPRAPGEVEIIIEQDRSSAQKKPADSTGFNANDIERLESFHGRLPKDSKE